MPPGDIAPIIGSALLFITVGAVLILRGPLGKALGRRIEGAVGPSPEIESRIQDLENRLAVAEHERAELAERMEFAERMLLQAKEAPREIGR